MNQSVSVIIPWRNTPINQLGRALTSIRAQCGEIDVEVVIVNDGSDDALVMQAQQIIAAHNREGGHAIMIHLRKRSGISAARNAGIEAASGDFIVWLDADDELMPAAVQELLRVSNCETYFLTVGDCIVVEKGGETRRRSQAHIGILHTMYRGTLFDPYITSVFAIQPQLVRTEVLRDVGGFNVGYPYAEMTDLFLRVASLVGDFGVRHVDLPLYRYYRLNPLAHSSNRRFLNEYRERALLEHAAREGIKVDGLRYVGRDALSGAQHYTPVMDGCNHRPPYLTIQAPVENEPRIQLWFPSKFLNHSSATNGELC